MVSLPLKSDTPGNIAWKLQKGVKRMCASGDADHATCRSDRVECLLDPAGRTLYGPSPTVAFRRGEAHRFHVPALTTIPNRGNRDHLRAPILSDETRKDLGVKARGERVQRDFYWNPCAQRDPHHPKRIVVTLCAEFVTSCSYVRS